MKLQGILIRKDGQDRDDAPLDPAMAEFDPKRDYPVTVRFWGPQIGTARLHLDGTGNVAVTVTVTDPTASLPTPCKAAAGGVIHRDRRSAPPSATAGPPWPSTIHSVGLTDDHMDENQPPLEVVPDAP